MEEKEGRIGRREFIGLNSLKTVDHCIKKPLLSDYSKNLYMYPNKVKFQNGLFLMVIENVLCSEDCKDIMKKSEELCFDKISKKYKNGKQRKSSRLLVIDEMMANKIWYGLEKVLKAEMRKHKVPKQPLGFSVTRGQWKLHGLNNAARICKYDSQEKEFFAPHFDAQFCPNADKRSLFSLLVYLNDGFAGGETNFYFPKNANLSTKGMTVEEEINANGGIENGYECVKILPSFGNAVLFSQNLLHESSPIITEQKYILKTDVLTKRNPPLGFLLKDDERMDYLQCTEFFRAGQQHELSGNYDIAGEYYERALSIRYCSKVDKTNNKTSSRNHQNSLVFLPFPNIINPPESPKRNSSELMYIPKVCYQHGVLTKFEFPDSRFFSLYVNGCCRVAAVYSLVLLGHSMDDDMYIAHFNPRNQVVLAVDLVDFLTAVFFNKECWGAFYVVRQIGEEKNPRKDLEACVDRTYMLMKHCVPFFGVEVPDFFNARRKVPESVTDQKESDESVDLDENVSDEFMSLQLYGETNIYPIEHVLRLYEQIEFDKNWGKHDMLTLLQEKRAQLNKNTEEMFYETVLKIANGQPSAACALTSTLNSPLQLGASESCICLNGPKIDVMNHLNEKCKTNFYNHLVADFEESELTVEHDSIPLVYRERIIRKLLEENVGDVKELEFHSVNISSILQPDTSFNHASCQCVHPSFETDEFCSLKQYPHLTSVHIGAITVDDKKTVWTAYSGVVAL